MDVAPLLDLARARGVAPRLALEPRFAREDGIPALYQARAPSPSSPTAGIEASGVLTLAVAHGRPIIASRIGAFAEELADGVHGALVPPRTTRPRSPRRWGGWWRDRGFAARCAANVRALAGAAPSWDEIGRRTAAVYAEASGDRRAGGGSLRAPAAAAAPAGRHARV